MNLILLLEASITPDGDGAAECASWISRIVDRYARAHLVAQSIFEMQP